MNQKDLWKILTDKNPKFLENGGNFTAAGLKKFYDQVWEIAHNQGFKNGVAKATMDAAAKPKDNGYGDILGSLFGGKK